MTNLEALTDSAAALGRAYTSSGREAPSWLAPRGGGARAVAYAAVIWRGVLLQAAWAVLHHGSGLGVGQMVGAALFFAASAAPLALSETAPAAAGGVPRRTLLALALGLEAAVLFAGAQQLGAAAAVAAAAAAAACLQQMQQRAVLPRLLGLQAAEGDAVEVHVTAQLDTGARFDAVEGSRTLKLFASGGALALQQQQEEHLAQAMAALLEQQQRRREQLAEQVEQEARQQQQQQQAAAQPSSSAASSDEPTSQGEAGGQPAASAWEQQEAAFAAEQEELMAQHEGSLVGLVPLSTLKSKELERWRPFLAHLQARAGRACELACTRLLPTRLPRGAVGRQRLHCTFPAGPGSCLRSCMHRVWYRLHEPCVTSSCAWAPTVQAALLGAYLGQPVSVKLHNPARGGYYNPDLCWWQPRKQVGCARSRVHGTLRRLDATAPRTCWTVAASLAAAAPAGALETDWSWGLVGGLHPQVVQKLGSPQVGDIFRFPLRDNDPGSWVAARINVMTEEACEIDANHGIAGRDVVLTVRVVRLLKGAAKDPAAAMAM